MKSDLRLKPWELNSSFMAYQKDCNTIVRKLFVENPLIAQDLKRLLIINTKDCLSNESNQKYKQMIDKASISWLRDNNYLQFAPIIKNNQHQEQKSKIIISIDNFVGTYNTEFRSSILSFEIICNSEFCQMQDYQIRPLKIAGYIDSVMNKARLSGIGQLQFVGCRQMLLDENQIGYVLRYKTINGTDDRLE